MATPTPTRPRTALQIRTDRRKAHERFLRARKVEATYARQLRQVARQVGHIVNGMAPEGMVDHLQQLNDMLYRYAELLRPWAGAIANRMLVDVAQRDEAAWMAHAKDIGISLRDEIANAPVGGDLREMQARQVHLITSLPIEAAERVHELSIEAISEGTRASEIAKEIMRSGEVTESRANLIARTEVGRAATSFTRVRAERLGSEGYIWETSRDGAVRPSHRAMQGKFVRWDSPPTLDGLTGAPGEIPNCRCIPRTILPAEFAA